MRRPFWRARRFNRLDPFTGKLNDPVSLHKYLYVHSDPIGGIDPTGREFSLAGMLGNMSIRANLICVGAVAAFRIGVAVWTVSATFNTWYEFRNRLNKQSEFGKGGYKADGILLKVRNEVISDWQLLDTTEKQSVIDYLHDFSTGQVAWEIPELAWDKQRWTENLVGEVAKGTLTYKGEVYPVEEVNYLLWGLVNGLAYKDGIRVEKTSIEGTLGKVALYRGAAGGFVIMDQWGKQHVPGVAALWGSGEVSRFETMSGKIAWSGYGWR